MGNKRPSSLQAGSARDVVEVRVKLHRRLHSSLFTQLEGVDKRQRPELLRFFAQVGELTSRTASAGAERTKPSDTDHRTIMKAPPPGERKDLPPTVDPGVAHDVSRLFGLDDA
jgi:hypothetical protein